MTPVGSAVEIAEELDKEDPSYGKVAIIAAGDALGAAIPAMGPVAKTLIKEGVQKLDDVVDVKQLTKDADTNAIDNLGLTEESLEAWKTENYAKDKYRIPPIEKLEEAAKALREGEITSAEFRELSDAYQPIIPIDEMPNFPTKEEVVQALHATDKRKVAKGIIGVNKEIPDGTPISARLDIPAYNDTDTWIVSLHDGTEKSGKTVGYAQTAVLDNVTFTTNPLAASSIASGKGKTTIARMQGSYVNADPEEIYNVTKELLEKGAEGWSQVGMNPYRASYFYDKADGMPVVSADEVIQVGPLVMAKNVKKTTPDDEMFQFTNKVTGVTANFSEGGMALEEQMEMNFGREVPDNTIGVDPVSGNEIPLGSTAENVRDDIPANLSEGEIVVPADVVNYWGVKLFEDLRAKAKMGYSKMAQDGRMGGEPMMEDMDIELTIEDLDVMDDQEPVEMYKGGYSAADAARDMSRMGIRNMSGSGSKGSIAAHNAAMKAHNERRKNKKKRRAAAAAAAAQAAQSAAPAPAATNTGMSSADYLKSRVDQGGDSFTGPGVEVAGAKLDFGFGGNLAERGARKWGNMSNNIEKRVQEEDEPFFTTNPDGTNRYEQFIAPNIGKFNPFNYLNEGGMPVQSRTYKPKDGEYLPVFSSPNPDFQPSVDPKRLPYKDRLSKVLQERNRIFPRPHPNRTQVSQISLADVRGKGDQLIDPDRKKFYDNMVTGFSESEKAAFDKAMQTRPSSILHAERQRQNAINKILSQRTINRSNNLVDTATRVRRPIKPTVDPRMPDNLSRPKEVKGPEDFKNMRQYYRYLRREQRKKRRLQRRRERARQERLNRFLDRLRGRAMGMNPRRRPTLMRAMNRGYDEGGLATPEPFYSQKGGFDLSHMKIRGTTVQEYQNDEGHRIFITFLNGVPQMEIPEGYFPVGDPINVNRLVNYSIPRMDGISPQPVSTYTEEQPQRSSGGGGGSSSSNIMDTVEPINYKELSIDELKAMITDQNTMGSKVFAGLSPITKVIMWDKTRRTKAEIERRLEDPETSEVDKIRLNNLLDLANREEPGLIKTLLDKVTGKEFERIVSQVKPPVKLDYDFSDPTLAPAQGIGDVYTPNPQTSSGLTTPGVDGVPLTREQIEAGKQASEDAAAIAFTPTPTQDKPKTEVEKMRSAQAEEDKAQKAKDRGKAFKDTADAAGSSIAELGRFLSPSDEKENIDYGDPRRGGASTTSTTRVTGGGGRNKGGLVKKKKTKSKKSK